MTIISTASVFRVRSGHEWALIALDDVTGLLAIESTFGSFNHIWPPHYRSQTLGDFVTTLNFDYFMTKTRGQQAREFDLDGTLKTLRQWVIESRVQCAIDKEEARDAWDALDDIRMEGPSTGAHLLSLISEDRARLHVALGDDVWDGFSTRYTPECEWFWETIWLKFVVAWWCRDGLESPGIGL